MIEEINSKLEQLGEYVSILREYQSYSFEEIKNNYTLRGAVERYMEISLACMIDTCEMIISSEKLRRPDTYKELFLSWVSIISSPRLSQRSLLLQPV